MSSLCVCVLVRLGSREGIVYSGGAAPQESDTSVTTSAGDRPTVSGSLLGGVQTLKSEVNPCGERGCLFLRCSPQSQILL